MLRTRGCGAHALHVRCMCAACLADWNAASQAHSGPDVATRLLLPLPLLLLAVRISDVREHYALAVALPALALISGTQFRLTGLCLGAARVSHGAPALQSGCTRRPSCLQVRAAALRERWPTWSSPTGRS
jgi:hypothetical protein